MNINKTVRVFVVEVLNGEEYEASPLVTGFCKEYLAQLVDKVENSLKNSLNDIEEIILEQESRILERRSLLRSLIESMVVYEITHFRGYRN